MASAAVVLLVERDHLALAREQRQHASVGHVDRRAATVQQHEGRAFALAMHLVVQLEAIDLRVSLLHRSWIDTRVPE